VRRIGGPEQIQVSKKSGEDFQVLLTSEPIPQDAAVDKTMYVRLDHVVDLIRKYLPGHCTVIEKLTGESNG
jgi:hypothetical protein